VIRIKPARLRWNVFRVCGELVQPVAKRAPP
jgi:hypothetical protein